MARYFDVQPAPDYLRSLTFLYERKAVAELWNKLTAVARQQWKWKNVPDKEDPKWTRVKKETYRCASLLAAGSLARHFDG